jgi:hypothetical protein
MDDTPVQWTECARQEEHEPYGSACKPDAMKLEKRPYMRTEGRDRLLHCAVHNQCGIPVNRAEGSTSRSILLNCRARSMNFDEQRRNSYSRLWRNATVLNCKTIAMAIYRSMIAIIAAP